MLQKMFHLNVPNITFILSYFLINFFLMLLHSIPLSFLILQSSRIFSTSLCLTCLTINLTLILIQVIQGLLCIPPLINGRLIVVKMLIWYKLFLLYLLLLLVIQIIHLLLIVIGSTIVLLLIQHFYIYLISLKN